MPSLKKNLIMQTLYQILITATPLITSPYISRALGAEQLGIYTYVSTTANYFIVIAGLGIASHGTRSIATHKKSIDEESTIYFQIRFIQCIIAFIVAIIYVVFVLKSVHNYRIIYFIQLLWILNCCFDVGWFFNGIEEFKVTVTRNLIIKAITIIGIFSLVHDKNDTWIYALILSSSTLFSNVLLWGKSKKYIKKIKISKYSAIKQLKPSFLLFLPHAAMTIYQQMDKSMLGSYGMYVQLGYYYNADKIINILIGIISGIGAVSFPRVSSLVSEQKRYEYEIIVKKTIALVMFFCSAIAFGIAAISPELTPILFGEEFKDSASVISALSLVIFFKSLSMVARNQYLLPLGKDIEYMVSVLFGVVINFLLNSLLIKSYGALGAVIATLLTEAIVCLFQLISMDKYIRIRSTVKNSIVYPLLGFSMYCCVRFISSFHFENEYIGLVSEMLCGAIVYVLSVYIFWKITNDKLLLPIVERLLKKYRIK